MSSEAKRPEWYQKVAQSINADAQRLLGNYSGLAPDEVLPHVFLYVTKHLMSTLMPASVEWVPRCGMLLRTRGSFIADQGIASNQLFGCDLEQVFIDLGYRLFRGKGRLQATFVVGDLSADDVHFNDGETVQKLNGRIDIVFASSLFHMWDWDTQFKVATHLVKICRQKPGIMITGRQMGSVQGDHYRMAGMKDGAVHYWHGPETMERFWGAVGEATQTSWKVEAGLYWAEEVDQMKNMPWTDDKIRMIWWCATRE